MASWTSRTVIGGRRQTAFMMSSSSGVSIYCVPKSSIISCAPSLPGAWDGMERTRRVSRRRGSRMEIVSPTRTSRPALASCPFTVTRPASHVSFASVRRKITRLHFKNRSRRIRSVYFASALFGFGDFLRLLRGAGIDISFCGFNKAVGAQFCEIFPDFRLGGLLPEEVTDLPLGQFERKNAAVMLVFNLENHESAGHGDDVT